MPMPLGKLAESFLLIKQNYFTFRFSWLKKKKKSLVSKSLTLSGLFYQKIKIKKVALRRHWYLLAISVPALKFLKERSHKKNSSVGWSLPWNKTGSRQKYRADQAMQVVCTRLRLAPTSENQPSRAQQEKQKMQIYFFFPPKKKKFFALYFHN